MGRLTIQASPELAALLRNPDFEKAVRVQELVRKYKASLHLPPAAGGETVCFVEIEGVPERRLQALLNELRDLGGIEAAYSKPEDALP